MYGEKQIINPGGINESDKLQEDIPVAPLTPDKKIIRTDIADLLAPFISFAALLGIVTFVFYNIGFGVTATYLGFLTFTTFYIVTKHKKFPVKAIFPLCLCIITALCYSLRYIDTFSLTIPFLFYLSGLFCMSLTDTAGSEFNSYISLYNQLKASLFLPIAKLFVPLTSLWKNRKRFGKSKKHPGILIGIICGIPVFIIVAKLLTEGDAAFSGVMNGFLSKFSELVEKIFSDVADAHDPIIILIALIFTPWVVSTIFAFRHGIVTEKLEKDRTEEAVKSLRFVSGCILGGFYGVVSICYVLYLVSQFSYLFGAFSGEVPLGISISISEYARRGFFEMSAVAVINLCLIGAGTILSKRDEKNKLPGIFKAFSVFFCIFTILLIVTAMSKMGLYITELGLTQKRILVSVADIILLVTFICVLIKIFKGNFPYMKIIMYTALSLVTLYFVVSPETMISHFNTWAYLSGYHKTIDMYTLQFEDDYQSAMAFDKLTQSKNEVVAASAKNELYEIYNMYAYDIEHGNSFSDLSSVKLVKFLKENEAKIKEYSIFSYYDVYYKYDLNKLTALTERNGGLIEIEKVNLTFSINTEKEIDELYITNNYCTQLLDNFNGMKSFTFEWEYSTSKYEVFADVEIEYGGQIYYKKIFLPDYSGYASPENSTYIQNNTFSFELRDSKDGEFVIAEV
ncbi:MAG: DUF4173 domain-containing protein [Clostridia bacterium]|nr:DUF4173 domain-containing protein [Clostridia bacterium]